MNYKGILQSVAERINLINMGLIAPIIKAEVLPSYDQMQKIGYKLPYATVAYLGATAGGSQILGRKQQQETMDLRVEITSSSYDDILNVLEKTKKQLIGFQPKAPENSVQDWFITRPIELIKDVVYRIAEKSVFVAEIEFRADFIVRDIPPTPPPGLNSVNYNYI